MKSNRTDVRSVYVIHILIIPLIWEIAKYLLDSRWGHFIVRERQSCTDVLFMTVNSVLVLILTKRVLSPTSSILLLQPVKTEIFIRPRGGRLIAGGKIKQ